MTNLEKVNIPLDERANYSKIKKTKRKVNKMTTNRTARAAQYRPAKRYQKTQGEHFKDIVIAILVTAIIAFVAGARSF